VYELAEVVRNLAIRESEKGLSTGEKQLYGEFLVNAQGESRFCKFHWEPVAGTHSAHVWPTGSNRRGRSVQMISGHQPSRCQRASMPII